MNNPCRECLYMSDEWFDNFEYGCENPCQKAKDYYLSVNKKLDEVLGKCRELLHNGENFDG